MYHRYREKSSINIVVMAEQFLGIAMDKYPRGVILDYKKDACYALLSLEDRHYLNKGEWIIHDRDFFHVTSNEEFVKKYERFW